MFAILLNIDKFNSTLEEIMERIQITYNEQAYFTVKLTYIGIPAAFV